MLVTPPGRVVSARVLDGPGIRMASDHRPLAAEGERSGHLVAYMRGGQAVTLALRPEKLGLGPITGANGTGLRGTVREVVYIGADTRFVVGLPTGETVVARVQNHGGHSEGRMSVGDPVKVVWDVEDVRPLVS